MDKKETFEYTYSAPEQEEIRRIREKYLPQEESTLDRLRKLDSAVGRKANGIAIVLGVVGTLIMGLGMSMCLAWADALFFPGIAVGLLGILGMALAYPVHRQIMRRERQRIAPEILRLTEELADRGK